MEYNKLVLIKIKVKKADQPKLLSYLKLQKIITDCKKLKGDFYDKAAFLLKEIIQGHPFASGNRRTALFVTLNFLKTNNIKTIIEDDPKYAKILTGIREGFYTNNDIIDWLKNGTIKKFER